MASRVPTNSGQRMDAALAEPRVGRVIEVFLPMPPTVNRLHEWSTKQRRYVRSAGYEKWVKAADNIAMAFAQLRGHPRIEGHFTARIILSSSKRQTNYDGDNRIKALLDWAQSRRLIKNDALCDGGSWEWGYAPYGCVLVLSEVIA